MKEYIVLLCFEIANLFVILIVCMFVYFLGMQKALILWNDPYLHQHIHIQVHLNKLECCGKVHLFQ